MFTTNEIREIIAENGGVSTFEEQIDQVRFIPNRDSLVTDLQQLTDDEMIVGCILGLI